MTSTSCSSASRRAGEHPVLLALLQRVCQVLAVRGLKNVNSQLGQRVCGEAFDVVRSSSYVPLQLNRCDSIGQHHGEVIFSTSQSLRELNSKFSAIHGGVLLVDDADLDVFRVHEIILQHFTGLATEKSAVGRKNFTVLKTVQNALTYTRRVRARARVAKALPERLCSRSPITDITLTLKKSLSEKVNVFGRRSAARLFKGRASFWASTSLSVLRTRRSVLGVENLTPTASTDLCPLFSTQSDRVCSDGLSVNVLTAKFVERTLSHLEEAA